MNIGKTLKDLRKRKGFSQKDLATKLSTTQSAIANYENNHRQPNLETLIDLSKALEVSVAYILGQTNQVPGTSKTLHPSEIDAADQFLELILANNIDDARIFLDHYLKSHAYEEALFYLIRYSLTKLGWLWEVGEITIAKEHQTSSRISHFIDYIMAKETLVPSKNKIVLGLTAIGEKHTFGIKMLLAGLEKHGYTCHFIGQGVPVDDLKKYLEDIKADYLIVGITSPFFFSNALDYIKISTCQTLLVGPGTHHKQVENTLIFKDYKECFDALR